MTPPLEDNTRMYQEAAAAPAVIRTQLVANRERVEKLGQALRNLRPRAVVTCARGSSDNAATFARYLIETRAGTLTSSLAPSVSSVYEAKADLHGTVLFAISQSGASPDLLASVAMARQMGALIVALVNVESSPLAQAADHTIPLCAGVEKSVAATKTFIATLTAIVHVVASWTHDFELLRALEQAPGALEQAWKLDWSAAAFHLQPATNMYVVARGIGLGIAQEAALKLKETCALHAEAFSAAEVKHGPMALVRKGFPVMMLAQHDEAHGSIEALATDFAGRGADVMLAGATSTATVLALPALAAHAVIEPILLIQSFYRLANALALARGCDPDSPPHLRKVTETV